MVINESELVERSQSLFIIFSDTSNLPWTSNRHNDIYQEVEDSFLTKVQRQFNKERITFATSGVGTTGHPNVKK